MVGGVLVERTVKDVLPAMTNNYEQVMVVFYLCQGECSEHWWRLSDCFLLSVRVSVHIDDLHA